MKADADRFFRSVSLALDAAHPDRFAHYHPTRKGANVIRAIVEGAPDRASIVVASFGSGKSMAAGTAALFVANDRKARPQLSEMASSIAGADRQLGRLLADRAAGRARGLPVLLEGHQESLAGALHWQAKDRMSYLHAPRGAKADPVAVLEKVAERARAQNADRIAIVWDEFGQHLEALVAGGRAESLLDVQRVAEWVSRQERPKATLTLLLHQNLFQYAGNLSQVARSNWRKIEGRFGQISYVEDSDETYDLIASIVSGLRPGKKVPAAKHFAAASKQATGLGLFKSVRKKGRLQKCLQASHPLLPATLHALPRLASRLAQNERTVFSFLREADLGRPVSLLDLYSFFAPSMQSDDGVGGSYRRWLETESAMSKVSDPLDREVLAATAILGLGTAGERTHVGKKALEFAVTGAGGADAKSVGKAVDSLIKRKLLLYRRNNDDISVWHGTDVDIRSRLKAAMDSLEGRVDVVEFLDRELPAKDWRPIEHNVRNFIRRYFKGLYVPASETEGRKDGERLDPYPGEDGVVLYCLAESRKEIDRALKFAKRRKGKEVLVVVPKEPVSVSGLVVELLALRSLQEDAELLAEDPFVPQEIGHLVDSAHENLSRVLERLVSPDEGSSTWFSGGRKMSFRDGTQFQKALSSIADRRFPSTPLVNNEMVVRHHLSRPMVNARKKLILGILERSDKEHLGFDPTATTPDVTLYRTVLLNTGLLDKSGTGKWATPARLEKGNPGLGIAWGLIKEFLTVPKSGQSFLGLVAELLAPPIGMRRGLIPILLASGLQAFARAIAIRREGHYLPDILASQVEDICHRPEEYTLDVFNDDAKFRKYMGGMIQVFSKEKPAEGDLFRQLHDAMAQWRDSLPQSALMTGEVYEQARKLQAAMRRKIDPVEFANKLMSEIIAMRKPGQDRLPGLKSAVLEIEGTIERYTSKAVGLISDLLAVSPDARGGVLERAHEWASCFAGSEALMKKFGGTSKAIISRSLQATGGNFTQASFARAMSIILLGKNLDQWDDAAARQFAEKLRAEVHQIEHVALMSSKPPKSLLPIVRRRISYLQEVEKRLAGGRRKARKTRRIA